LKTQKRGTKELAVVPSLQELNLEKISVTVEKIA